MAASLFEAMAVALVKGPEEASAAGSAPEIHEQERTLQDKLCHVNQEYMPLVKADPNTFYADAAFFARVAPRVRFSKNTACLLPPDIQVCV